MSVQLPQWFVSTSYGWPSQVYVKGPGCNLLLRGISSRTGVAELLLSEVSPGCPLEAAFRKYRADLHRSNPEIYLDPQPTPGVWRCTFPPEFAVWLVAPNFNSQDPSEFVLTFEEPTPTP